MPMLGILCLGILPYSQWGPWPPLNKVKGGDGGTYDPPRGKITGFIPKF